MSRSISLKRAERSCFGLAIAAACFAAPGAAQAAAVNLGTASPFAVLGGASVTNTGPSVLNGDLGVSPGTSLPGFGPATITGTIHNNDSVADIAQDDLTTAYNSAAAEPVPAGNVLTGQDLGGLTLVAGNYGFATSAGLTGQLTLDAQGNPNAQWVFEIGSTLTTASASSVVLTNGASPCNVYWQVGSSATIDTTTAFQGNLMTLSDITLNNGASVIGRLLAQRGGAVTLDDNLVSNAGCPPPTSGGSGGGSGGSGGGSTGTGGGTPPASTSTVPTHLGTAKLRSTAKFRRAPGTTAACTAGFTASVTGRMIRTVEFKLDGKRIAVRSGSPYRVSVGALAGRHAVTARVSFTDATKTVTRKLSYRACGAAALSPRPGVSHFTG